MLYESLGEAIEHVTFPSPSSLNTASPLLLQSAWAKQALTGVSETFVTVDDDESEAVVRSLFEEGRDWREGEIERMEVEFEEVRNDTGIDEQIVKQYSAYPLLTPLIHRLVEIEN